MEKDVKAAIKRKGKSSLEGQESDLELDSSDGNQESISSDISFTSERNHCNCILVVLVVENVKLVLRYYQN